MLPRTLTTAAHNTHRLIGAKAIGAAQNRHYALVARPDSHSRSPALRVLHPGTPYLLSPLGVDLNGERRDHENSLSPFHVRFLDGFARKEAS